METLSGPILVVNPGSSSIKYRLFDDQGHDLLRVQYDRTETGATRTWSLGDAPASTDVCGGEIFERSATDVQQLMADEIGNEGPAALGFRVVHGGPQGLGTAWVTEDLRRAMRKAIPLAPLHNPPCLALMEEWTKVLPRVPHYAVFDTAFHATIPPFSRTYGLPAKLEEELDIQRYGFHGIVYASILRQLREQDSPFPRRLIACHLGSGVSLCAIGEGKSMETSMGMTPLEGLLMATRTGDVDPGVVLLLMEHLGQRFPTESSQNIAHRLRQILSEEGGLLGIAGSKDMRIILATAERNDAARLARDSFVARVQKYLGAYAARLGGVDGVVFSGGIGEGSAEIRERIIGPLGFLGLSLDPEANRELRETGLISAVGTTPIWVMRPQEEREIFREGCQLLGTEG